MVNWIRSMAWLAGCGTLMLATACDDSEEPMDGGGHVHEVDANVPCPPSTPEFSFGPTEGMLADSESGRMQSRLIEAMPAPPEKYENDWTIELTAPDGMPLDDVDLTRDDVRAWMPTHGHGGPPERVAASSEPGRFELVNLNLFMRGPWLIEIEAESASSGSDFLTFTVCVADD